MEISLQLSRDDSDLLIAALVTLCQAINSGTYQLKGREKTAIVEQSSAIVSKIHAAQKRPNLAIVR